MFLLRRQNRLEALWRTSTFIGEGGSLHADLLVCTHVPFTLIQTLWTPEWASLCNWGLRNRLRGASHADGCG